MRNIAALLSIALVSVGTVLAQDKRVVVDKSAVPRQTPMPATNGTTVNWATLTSVVYAKNTYVPGKAILLTPKDDREIVVRPVKTTRGQRQATVSLTWASAKPIRDVLGKEGKVYFYFCCIYKGEDGKDTYSTGGRHDTITLDPQSTRGELSEEIGLADLKGKGTLCVFLSTDKSFGLEGAHFEALSNLLPIPIRFEVE